MSEFSVRPDWMAFLSAGYFRGRGAGGCGCDPFRLVGEGPAHDGVSKKFAEYVGAKHCIAVNSCTAALHLALLTQESAPATR